MSYVTTIIFTCSLSDDDMLGKVNAFFAQEDKRGFADMAALVGGYKAAQACMWTGAFNHLDEEKFGEHLRGLRWQAPEAVRIFVNREHDDGFETVMMCNWRPMRLGMPDEAQS